MFTKLLCLLTKHLQINSKQIQSSASQAKYIHRSIFNFWRNKLSCRTTTTAAVPCEYAALLHWSLRIAAGINYNRGDPTVKRAAFLTSLNRPGLKLWGSSPWEVHKSFYKWLILTLPNAAICSSSDCKVSCRPSPPYGTCVCKRLSSQEKNSRPSVDMTGSGNQKTRRSILFDIVFHINRIPGAPTFFMLFHNKCHYFSQHSRVLGAFLHISQYITQISEIP